MERGESPNHTINLACHCPALQSRVICVRLLLVTVFERRAYFKNQVSVSTEAIPEIKAAKVAKRSPDGSRGLMGVTYTLAFFKL